MFGGIVALDVLGYPQVCQSYYLDSFYIDIYIINQFYPSLKWKSFVFSPAVSGEYRQISSTHFCEHVESRQGSREAVNCRKSGVSNCRQECDQLSTCVGYSEQSTDTCYLFPSGDNPGCPNGWTTQDENKKYATASSRLVVRTAAGYNCYTKGIYKISHTINCYGI